MHVQTKKDLLDLLKKLGVSAEERDKLQKMGVRKMVALTMISHSEDEEESVILEKTERSNLEFKVGLRWIRVYPDMESKTQLKARIEIDYTHEVDWLYGEVKINLPEGTELAESCVLDLVNEHN